MVSLPDPVVSDPTVADAVAVAEEAGLRYVSDAGAGIRRRRRGKGFSYAGPDGEAVDGRTRERIHRLAVPPAWVDVWICPSASGHLQATGRDARGRKQYRYHDRWREVRDADKFSRLLAFGEALPKLRGTVADDLVGSTDPRQQVLAAVLRLLDDTLIRVGNEEYARVNDSFGLTTLRPEHVERVSTRAFTLRFVGKSGVEHDVTVVDPKLARLVRRCSELSGQDLFSYRTEDGALACVSSGDVNEYLHRHVGPEISAKVFRTWGATTIVANALVAMPTVKDEPGVDAQIVAAIDIAAEQLRNTRAVCRQSYVHPAVLDAHRDGSLHEAWRTARSATYLDRADQTVLRVLRAAP